VNQASALESMVGTFLPQVMPSDATQLFVHKRNKDLEGLLIPGSPSAEQGADRLGRRFGHTHTLGPLCKRETDPKNRARDSQSQSTSRIPRALSEFASQHILSERGGIRVRTGLKMRF
jgi:hypothetical protein